MSYEYFPNFYDALMDEELYDNWFSFAKPYLPEPGGKVLDVACGTAELAVRLAKNDFEVTGVDLSEEMLAVASEKALREDVPLTLLQQDMSQMEALDTFDLVTCFCDSLNYLETEAQVYGTLQSVYANLKEGGIFLFDVHSVYKVDECFKDYSYGDSDIEISCVWNSFPGEFPHSVEHELTFFRETPNGLYERYDELHKERTYPVEWYQKAITEAGFRKIKICADFTNSEPTKTSERIFFICEK
ncbi:class I SAM-dependent DNA methyltransferase [Listeria booriae]|uniref:Class I SAM-dependent methyltransferase n=1 Tax=Listeria booriae TaxID=1552123 RepID=A0A841ZTY9_9LIST|nr:class I SAM-dependent methyltransferase [Listeria booriae]MBC1563807.1 class I SAM-dependent methyltransferase [Listeria booriae]MBC2241006.1 class I SAM-dependent methyltransferase [Listeria booriae]MBC2243607.1 class I SAM-dependent methyltransferase [Listeria booriae]